MQIDVVTIFPEYLAPLNLSLIGRAQTEGLLQLGVHNLRDWTTDRHRTVDDTPVGGGAGMVMRPDVWGLALDDVLGTPVVEPPVVELVETTNTGASPVVEPVETTSAVEPPCARYRARKTPQLIIPTPSGSVFTQADAERLANASHLVFACGRYEGIDARVAEHYREQGVAVSEFSIGDYVLAGGEAAALVMIEAIVRLLPGVLGNPESLVEESHTDVLLEYPVYTRPITWADRTVPAVLSSGNHAQVARWRRGEALLRTAQRRPDLLRQLDVETLSRADRDILRSAGWEIVDDHLTNVA